MRMIQDKPFSELTFAQMERLDILAEEAGEVIVAVSKIKRHGYFSINPFKPDDGCNRDNLEKEIGDFLNAMEMLIDSCDIYNEPIQSRKHAKAVEIKEWLHHQTDSNDTN